MKFKRFCIRCGKLFRPTGRYAQICEKCKKPKGRGKKNTLNIA